MTATEHLWAIVYVLAASATAKLRLSGSPGMWHGFERNTLLWPAVHLKCDVVVFPAVPSCCDAVRLIAQVYPMCHRLLLPVILQIAVICGRNKKLLQKLQSHWWPGGSHVVPCGFVNNIHEVS